MEGAGGREARRRVGAWLVAALEGRGPWLPTDDGARGLLLIFATESLGLSQHATGALRAGLWAGAGSWKKIEHSFHVYKKAQQPKSKHPQHSAGDARTPQTCKLVCRNAKGDAAARRSPGLDYANWTPLPPPGTARPLLRQAATALSPRGGCPVQCPVGPHAALCSMARCGGPGERGGRQRKLLPRLARHQICAVLHGGHPNTRRIGHPAQVLLGLVEFVTT